MAGRPERTTSSMTDLVSRDSSRILTTVVLVLVALIAGCSFQRPRVLSDMRLTKSSLAGSCRTLVRHPAACRLYADQTEPTPRCVLRCGPLDRILARVTSADLRALTNTAIVFFLPLHAGNFVQAHPP